jgi:hypothetical protein
VLTEIVDSGSRRPARVYLALFDGLSHSELVYHLVRNPAEIPNLAWLAGRGAILSHGSIVNFPSITWPSHSTILTGAWCGHHDITNPTFYLRETRETVPVQGQVFETERYLGPGVETLYELFKRVGGPDVLTASIHEPQGRGADHAAFERRIVGDKARLKEITQSLMDDISPRWMADNKPAMHREEVIDLRGVAQLVHLFEHCGERVPVFIAHEFVLTDGAGHDYGPHHAGLREALYRTDRRLGVVLGLLRRRGLLDSTLFVVTSDHGMAPQRVELAANPAREPEKAGVRGVFAEPFIYLRDLAVECERTRDGRNLRVVVLDNDPEPSAGRPPVEGARIIVRGPGDRPLGEATTLGTGTAAIAIPANLRDCEITLRVEHPSFNPRTLGADGARVAPDLRTLLYGTR